MTMRKSGSVRLGLYIAALALGVSLLHSPIAPLTLAPLAIGVLVGLAANSGREAFGAGAIIGFAALTLTVGASIGRALAIVAGIAGGPLAILVVAYHVLTPAFIAGAVRLLLG